MINRTSKEVVGAGLFICLGILTPILFHIFGGLGPVFLPMHIPVLIAGFFLNPSIALFVGILTPLLSSILTGMPILFPIGIIMMIELGTYALAVSILVKKRLKSITVLLFSMVLGRIAAGIAVFLIVGVFGIKFPTPVRYIQAAVVSGMPGIVIQIIVIPSILLALKSSKLYNQLN